MLVTVFCRDAICDEDAELFESNNSEKAKIFRLRRYINNGMNSKVYNSLPGILLHK